MLACKAVLVSQLRSASSGKTDPENPHYCPCSPAESSPPLLAEGLAGKGRGRVSSFADE